jgi:hypothetical protein
MVKYHALIVARQKLLSSEGRLEGSSSLTVLSLRLGLLMVCAVDCRGTALIRAGGLLVKHLRNLDKEATEPVLSEPITGIQIMPAIVS